MDNNFGITVGIAIAVIAAIGIGLKALLNIRESKVLKERESKVRELEIKVRMASGLEVVNDFNDLACAYIDLNRLNDAEACMRKALAITESELGQLEPTLVLILENYASVLDKMNRTVEAERLRKRAREISAKRRGDAG